MLGNLFSGMIRKMSRSNGISLAKAIAAQVKKQEQNNPGRPPVEYWEQVLAARRGWKLLRAHLYQYRAGDRFEFRAGQAGWPVGRPEKEWLARITTIEVKPLSKGMPPQVREALANEAVEAAADWWEKRGD